MEASVHEFAGLAMGFLLLSEENLTNHRGAGQAYFSRFSRLPPFSKQLS